MLVLCDEPAHGAEPGQDQRVHAGLGATGEHRIGVAAAYELGRLADRVGAGRARRDDGVVRPPDAERDRKLAARRVDEHVRQEVRRHPFRPALSQHLALLHDPDEAADRRAEDDAHARGIEAVQPGIGDGLLRRRERKQDVAIELAHLLRRGGAARVEVLHLGGDPHGKAAWVERADEVDPALAGERRAPRRARVVPDRRDGAEARDDDASHGAGVRKCRAAGTMIVGCRGLVIAPLGALEGGPSWARSLRSKPRLSSNRASSSSTRPSRATAAASRASWRRSSSAGGTTARSSSTAWRGRNGRTSWSGSRSTRCRRSWWSRADTYAHDSRDREGAATSRRSSRPG